MSTLKLIPTFLFLFMLVNLSAQVNEAKRPISSLGNNPSTYPGATKLQIEALRRFDASFEEQDIGFLHVYAQPTTDPEGTYLLAGEKLSSDVAALLPNKFLRMAERENAELYAAAAIRGVNENLYLIRMDGPQVDRIEMFAIRGNEVDHLQSLAVLKQRNNRSVQTDTYITDVDGDSYLELVTIKKNNRGEIGQKRVYVMDRDNRVWKRTTELDVPWSSIELYQPTIKKR